MTFVAIFLIVVAIMSWLLFIDRGFKWYGSKSKGFSKDVYRQWAIKSAYWGLMFIFSLAAVYFVGAE